MSDVIIKHFWCYECSKYWKTSDFMSGDEYDYYSKCPQCSSITKAVPYYYGNLPKMRTTGPKTEAGKQRSSVNAIKHGMFASAHHLLAPANGKYDICRECDSLSDCKYGKLKYCPFKQDMMLRFLAAYENGDMEYLKTMAGLTQGKLMLVLDNCFNEIMSEGVLIKSLKVSNGRIVYHKKPVDDGGEVAYEDDYDNPLFEFKSNPLIDVLPKIIETAGMSSNQQKMNPGKQEDVDEDKLKGLRMDEGGLMTFMGMMNNFMTLMGGGSLAETAANSRDSDPVHVELENANEDEERQEQTGPVNNPFGRKG